jgi:hypothetical protein
VLSIPELSTDASSYRFGDLIAISYANMTPGTEMTIQQPDDPDYRRGDSLLGAYGDVAGTFQVYSGAPGPYEIRAYSADDRSILLARSPAFAVVDDSASLVALRTTLIQGDAVRGEYHNYQESAFFAVAVEGAPPDAYLERIDADGSDGTLTFNPVVAGQYRIRAYANRDYAPALIGQSALITVTASCTAASDCESGHCTDGVCCNADACGTCGRCDDPDDIGHCAAILAAPPGACGGYACDTHETACPTSCVSDGNCTAGYRCSDDGHCVAICQGDSCSCGDGQKYCATTSRCIPQGDCCVDADCSVGADSCLVAAGARCVSGICAFASRACPDGQACRAGRCEPSPLVLEVVATSTDSGDTDDALANVELTARLTNAGSDPVVVYATDLDGLRVTSVTRDGVAVKPIRRGFIFEKIDVALAGARTVLQPGDQVSWSMIGVHATSPSAADDATQLAYRSQGPGEYSLAVEYQPVGADATAYAGRVTAQPVVINVH